MKNILVIIIFFTCFVTFGQVKQNNLKTKIFTVLSDTIQIDSVSINSNYFKVYDPAKRELDSVFYEVDFAKAYLILNKDIKGSLNEIIVEYRALPEFLTQTYKVFDKDLIVPRITDDAILYKYQDNRKNDFFKPFDGLYTSGSLSRGLTIGNNQDAVVNSNFNLQIEGNLSKNVGIRASITDNEIPLQQGGYTQRLDQFDKVYIKLFSDHWSVRAGDVDLMNTDSYFMRFQKKVSGVSVNAKLDHSDAQTNVFASGALVKGRFSNYKFNGVEGNQGPYGIYGPDNEQFVMIVSGSERVYANGMLLKRGENFDYTIDYNTSEITFTTVYTVTSNQRFTIEYQIADMNYIRYITYDGADFQSDKIQVGINYYNETDAKNKPVQQDLTDIQKQILKESGDDKYKMVAPSATPAIYSENKILYKRIINNNGVIYAYSTDSNDELYQVNFSYVGENKGNYIIETTLATGRVYAFIDEVNNSKQGSYSPIVQLIAPEKFQIITAKANYNPSDKTNIRSELAFSEKDQNLYSNLDDENNLGFATKVNWQQIILDKKWQLKSHVDYEYIDKDFKTIERFRNVEFSRDWNIDRIFELDSVSQQSVLGGLSYSNDSIGLINYQYENLQLGDLYSGSRQSLQANILFKNTKVFANGSLLNNEDLIAENTFQRWYSTIIHDFSNSWVGAKFNYEHNERKEIVTQELSDLSHRFSEVEGFFGLGDSTKVFAEIAYNFRSTDSLQISHLQNVSKANTFFLRSKLVQNKNVDLALFANYRAVKNVNIEDEKSLNLRLIYRQSLFDNFIILQTLYETQTGNLPQQEFTYVEVEPGKGFYEWIDFNGNGIQELDEFIKAQFQDQAKFVRVLLPTIHFIKTAQNKFSQSINLNANQWQGGTGWKKVLSHFSNQTYFLFDTKEKREGSSIMQNPFNFDEENLLSLDLNLKNSLFFNRGLQKYSMAYSLINTRKKSIFVFGDQDVKLLSHQLQFIHKIGKFWLLDLKGGLSESSSKSNSYANRNYSLINSNIHPKLSYLVHKNARLESFYKYKSKENRIGESAVGTGNETLQMHVFGANFQFSNKQKFSVNANVNLYFNEFEGNTNSPVAYQMLEGLQPGTNLTWLLNLQKRLTSFLDLNLNYLGRSSENSKTIHTGTMQLRASF